MKRNKFFQFNRNKYNAKKTTCLSNHSHDSRGESDYCNYLLSLVKEKEIESYITQVRYPLAINGHHITTHIVDFQISNTDGSTEVVEYKGFATEIWRIKKKLFEAIYTDIPYTVVNHREKGW